METHIRKAAVLIEALPYLQEFRGATFLIKVGGSAMEDPELVGSLLRDIVFLEVVGINPVIVHGGGKAISRAMQEAGLEARFVGGLRVTDASAVAIVEQTLGETINPQLVAGIESAGGRALGVPGNSVFIAERHHGKDPATGQAVDLGYVGQVVDFHLDQVAQAIAEEIVPVLSPIGRDRSTGETLNINADLAASALGSRLQAAKILYLSDVLGVLRDPADPSSLIPSLDRAAVETAIGDRVISGGMIPKVRSALEALEAGVGKVHLIDGRIPHSVLLEIFTRSGVGTEITR
ncbi:MAG TPA: acetylglutamate kinase [Verrucomicrobiales bacterium]|nr:acetylglutamate kinase [Verrucomicrobiales bacterium]